MDKDKTRDNQSQAGLNMDAEKSEVEMVKHSPDARKGIFDKNDSVPRMVYEERQRLKAEVEKAIDDFSKIISIIDEECSREDAEGRGMGKEWDVVNSFKELKTRLGIK